MICKSSSSVSYFPVGHYLQTDLQIWWCPFPVYNSGRATLDLCPLNLLGSCLKQNLQGLSCKHKVRTTECSSSFASPCNLTFLWLNYTRYCSVSVDLLEPEKQSAQLALFIKGCIPNTKASRSDSSFPAIPAFAAVTGGLHRHRCLASGFKCAHIFTFEWDMHPNVLDSKRATLNGKTEISSHFILPLSVAAITVFYTTLRRRHRQALAGGVECYILWSETPRREKLSLSPIF